MSEYQREFDHVYNKYIDANNAPDNRLEKYVESCREKLQSIAEFEQSSKRGITEKQSQACQNMLSGLKKWVN